jgi:hypothetical protein
MEQQWWSVTIPYQGQNRTRVLEKAPASSSSNLPHGRHGLHQAFPFLPHQSREQEVKHEYGKRLTCEEQTSVSGSMGPLLFIGPRRETRRGTPARVGSPPPPVLRSGRTATSGFAAGCVKRILDGISGLNIGQISQVNHQIFDFFTRPLGYNPHVRTTRGGLRVGRGTVCSHTVIAGHLCLILEIYLGLF